MADIYIDDSVTMMTQEEFEAYYEKRFGMPFVPFTKEQMEEWDAEAKQKLEEHHKKLREERAKASQKAEEK